MPTVRPLHLGVALDGAGRHPAAWREPDADAAGLFTADRLVRLVQAADRGGFDFVTLADTLDGPERRPGRVQGALDALLALARVAPLTRSIGLVPVITTTHTEPFHLSKNLATLDWVSTGRAGWKVAVSTTEAAAAHFGRKPAASSAEAWAEAADAIDVVGRLWDSWEDDAIIRDVPTGRYVDRDRLHYIDYTGRFFSVRGPSITPRSPQAHPLVVVDATSPEAAGVAAAWADIIGIDVADIDAAGAARDAIRAGVATAGRDPDTVSVLAIVDVLLAADDATARAERARLDAVAGDAGPLGVLDLACSPTTLVALIEEWAAAGAVDGFTLRPTRLPRDLGPLVDEVLPALVQRGRVPAAPVGSTLRDHFGLARPANRYATT